MKNIDVITTQKINFNNLLEDLISCFKHNHTSTIPSSFREFIESILIDPIWIDIELIESERIPFINILIDNELILVVDDNETSYKLRSTQKLESMKVKLTSEFEKSLLTHIPFADSIEYYCKSNNIDLNEFKKNALLGIKDKEFKQDFINYINEFDFYESDFDLELNDRWVSSLIEWLEENE